MMVMSDLKFMIVEVSARIAMIGEIASQGVHELVSGHVPKHRLVR
jgi:hypothetical protein